MQVRVHYWVRKQLFPHHTVKVPHPYGINLYYFLPTAERSHLFSGVILVRCYIIMMSVEAVGNRNTGEQQCRRDRVQGWK